MCGFFGYLNKFKISSETKNKIKHLDIYLKNRGPDFSSDIINSNYFLKHWRLKIQDLDDRSNQPYVNSKANLLYNGELYNFKKLKKNKKIKSKFITTGDTEVLFNYLNEIGVRKTLKKLEGMFSFIYHIKNTNKIYLARDRFGQKPLYYFLDEKEFIFSSEIKPIIYLLGKKNKIDLNELKNYFYHNLYYGKEKTFFHKIKQVLPGTYLVFDNFKLKKEVYYNSNNLNKNKKIFRVKSFSKDIKNTVDKHLIADKDICLSLSSGVDSKSLVAVIKKSKYKKNLKKSYSFSFEGFNSENKDAKKFSNLLGIENENITIFKYDVIKNFKKLIQINEGPIGGIANIAMLLLCQKIKKNGFNILLGGYGMDEALYGYNSFNFLSHNKNNNFRMPDITTDFNFLHKDFVKDFNSHQADKLKYQMLFEDKIPRTVHMCDRFSMVNSVELRLPYLDHIFIENVSNYFYENYFYNNSNISKKPLREFLRSLNLKNMPSWIFKKNHNPSPQNIWLKQDPIKSWLYQHLNSNKLYKKFDFLKKKEILNAWELYLSNNKNINGYFFWQLLNLYYLVDIRNFKYSEIKKNNYYINNEKN